MALTKYKLGDLIFEIKEINNIHNKNFYGININKDFMPTIAKTDDLDEEKYKIVKRNRFVFSGMQTGRDECIRISMYDNDDIIIVSPAYTTFEIQRHDLIIPEYLFMIFLSKEKDRLGWFLSDSSIRANLDWDVFCDIDIYLPDISIQQKYVNIYNSMVANQKAYEKGLDDLKLSLILQFEKIKKIYRVQKLKNILKECDKRNSNGIRMEILGINIDKQFITSVSNDVDINIDKYKIINNMQFAYSSMQTGRDKSIRFALYDRQNPSLVSPAYSVLDLYDNNILPEYIMINFMRDEMDRYGWFISDASVRANLDLDRFFQISIPIPPLHIQESIVNIYNVYLKRKEINDKLKEKIKEICPVLVKGALDEGV